MHAALLPLILLSTSLVFLNGTLAYGATEIQEIDGTIQESGCAQLNGSITTITVDEAGVQSIDVCEFEDRIFRISTGTDCPPVMQTGGWVHPDTGKKYSFGYVCAPPQMCDDNYVPGFWPAPQFSNYSTNTIVEIQNREFNVVVWGTENICHIELLNEEDKSVAVKAIGAPGTKGSMLIEIPDELLSGNFTVMTEGRGIEFDTRGNVTAVDFSTDFSEGEVREVKIIGTKLLPEFPVAAFAAGIPIAALVILRIFGFRLVGKS